MFHYRSVQCVKLLGSRSRFITPYVYSHRPAFYFSTLTDKLNDMKQDVKQKVSSAKANFTEIKGDLKGKSAELTGQLKGKMKENAAKMEVSAEKLKDKIEAIDSNLQANLKDYEEQQTSGKSFDQSNSMTNSNIKTDKKTSDPMQKRYFSTGRNINDKNYSSRLKPGEMIESSATENRNIPTTENPSANEESVEHRKYKQKLDSYNTADANYNTTATDLDKENISNSEDSVSDRLSASSNNLLNDLKEKSYEMKDSLPALDRDAIKNSMNSIKKKANQLKETLNESDLGQQLKDKAETLSDRAKSTFQSVTNSINEYTTQAIDSVEQKLGVEEAREKLQAQSNKLKNSLGNLVPDRVGDRNTADASKEQLKEYERQMRFGAGRLEERIEDDSINPADVNVKGDKNLNIDIQTPESIATAPDTNIETNALKQNVAGSDLSEIDELANEERFGRMTHNNQQTGKPNLSTQQNSNSKFPAY